MEHTSSTRQKRLKAVPAHIAHASAKRAVVPKSPPPEALSVRLEKSDARFKRIKNPHGRDNGTGEFLMILHVRATSENVYIPLSMASGKKPTGFVYQIEGTGPGTISHTDTSYKGVGVTQITLGTIVYTKIPKGSTATFRLRIFIGGIAERAYRVVINRINYKLNPSDARYQKYQKEIGSKMVTFH